jgi:protein-ribulosamine 3-kinase
VIPPALRRAVESRFGVLRSAAAVPGGSVHPAARVETDGGTLFLKYDPSGTRGIFAAEARGLTALRAATADLVVPEALAWSDAEDDAPAWLALPWLEPAPPADRGERLGHGVASLHRARSGGGWGWPADGFIGPLPQDNRPAPTWAEFWRERRLGPPLRRLRAAGVEAGSNGAWERLLDLLPELLAPAEADGPSLLHGDLWSGNVLHTARGPALIDPAAYRGHREADLAMAELFGGFPPRFGDAYREAWPLAPGWPRRRAAYQLWYLLVHLELFGAAYLARVEAALRTAIGRAA